MNTASLLASDDFCRRQAHYLARWEPPARTPKQILRLAIEHGLLSDADDPGEAAADYAMELATERTIDTAETDLLGLAAHISSLADFISWMLRTEGPWVRPSPVALPSGQPWTSGAFLSHSGLKHVALIDRLDGLTEMSLRHSWGLRGESSVYQLPVDVIAIEIGSLRQGRWSNPFTLGRQHPQGKMLRFRKRDGSDFSENWPKINREDYDGTREDWLDALTDDGVLEERVHVFTCDVPEKFQEIVSLAEIKLDQQSDEVPDQQPSRCFDRLAPCPYRGTCPQGIEPSESRGFISIAWPL